MLIQGKSAKESLFSSIAGMIPTNRVPDPGSGWRRLGHLRRSGDLLPWGLYVLKVEGDGVDADLLLTGEVLPQGIDNR